MDIISLGEKVEIIQETLKELSKKLTDCRSHIKLPSGKMSEKLF